MINWIKSIIIISLLSISSIAPSNATEIIDEPQAITPSTPNEITQTCVIYSNVARALWHNYFYLSTYYIKPDVLKDMTPKHWKAVFHEYVSTFYTQEEKASENMAHQLVEMLFTGELYDELVKNKATALLVSEIVFTTCIRESQAALEGTLM